MAKRRRRKTRKKQTRFPIEVFGVIIIFLSLLAIGQFGFMGIFTANILRALVGETYVILAGSFIILGIYLIFKGEWPNFFNRVTIGLTLTYLRSEEHTSELQSRFDLVCRLLLEKKNRRRYQASVMPH